MERTVGELLRGKRKQYNLGLKDVAEKISVSVMYVSEIERDKKVPSDEVIRKIAELYSIEEKQLFEMFGRVPEEVKEEITENNHLFNTLYGIANNDKISKSQKERLYEQLHQLYKELEAEDEDDL